MKFFSSSDAMKRVLECGCRIKTKILMIKFIEKIRLNIRYPDTVIKWKDIVQPNTLKRL